MGCSCFWKCTCTNNEKEVVRETFMWGEDTDMNQWDVLTEYSDGSYDTRNEPYAVHKVSGKLYDSPDRTCDRDPMIKVVEPKKSWWEQILT